MAADSRRTRWRLLGFGLAVLLALLLPALSDLVGHEFRLILVVPIAAAFAAALVLLSFERPEHSRPLLQSEPPSTTQIAPPRWAPLFYMALGALLTVWVDGSLGDTGSRMASLLFMLGTLWFGMHLRDRQSA